MRLSRHEPRWLGAPREQPRENLGQKNKRVDFDLPETTIWCTGFCQPESRRVQRRANAGRNREKTASHPAVYSRKSIQGWEKHHGIKTDARTSATSPSGVRPAARNEVTPGA